MIRNNSIWRATALGAVALLSVAGCGKSGGDVKSAASTAAPSATASTAAPSATAAPAGGRQADPLGRGAVDADVDAATAEAGLRGLSPGPDPDATSPAERRLGDCTFLWMGSPDVAVGTGTGAEPYAAVLRALEKRGWSTADHVQEGAVTQTRLQEGAWILMAKLTETDRVDTIMLAAHHTSCADVAALPNSGLRP
ncbi:hypothetical protein EF912_01945 [Streptomyces sp. WAC07061]|uniref:hypothetical protein n=1 Tax=Streptomyces sp. WAC07061 TaxID=2487410 RepID=UPI000F79350A|nr:hypothetical protein [Streptomyces sp. WAC07061]RSS64652.1 hypothetical protein EF912_01945 [Streptomyces sp. WAC07061]